MGEENYLKQEIVHIIKKKVITGTFSNDFNFHHFFSPDVDLYRVIDICNTLPVFSDKRLVILEGVDKFKSLKPLQDYANSPSLNTILILNSDERSINNLKAKNEKMITAIFYSLFDNQLVEWVITMCQRHNKNILAGAAQKLIHLCDNSLLEINNEVEKLLIYCNNKEKITIEDVEQLIGDVKGYDVFKLIDAVLSSQYQLSLRIFKKLFEAGNNIYSIFTLLNKSLHEIFLIKFLLEIKKMDYTDVISKLRMNPFRYKNITANIRKYNIKRLSQVIKALFEFDYKFKSYTAVNKNHLFEDLIYHLKLQ